MLTQPDFALTP